MTPSAGDEVDNTISFIISFHYMTDSLIGIPQLVTTVFKTVNFIKFKERLNQKNCVYIRNYKNEMIVKKLSYIVYITV